MPTMSLHVVSRSCHLPGASTSQDGGIPAPMLLSTLPTSSGNIYESRALGCSGSNIHLVGHLPLDNMPSAYTITLAAIGGERYMLSGHIWTTLVTRSTRNADLGDVFPR